MWRRFALVWNDESGFILSAELVLISTILVLGLIVGLTSLQTAVVGELTDVSGAMRSLNQSYWYKGLTGRSVWGWCGMKSRTAGSAFVDRSSTGAVVEDDIIGSGCVVAPAPETKVAPSVVVPKSQPCPDNVPCPPATEGTTGPQMIPPCHSCEPLPVKPGETLTPMPESHGPSDNTAPMEAVKPMKKVPQAAPSDLPREKKPPMKSKPDTL